MKMRYNAGQKRSRHDLCVVCADESDGQSLHFGQPTCRACAAFFRRSISQKLQYTCQRNGVCEIGKGARNACRACRFQKCVAQGMLPSTVQNNREMVSLNNSNNHNSNHNLLPPLTTSPGIAAGDIGSSSSSSGNAGVGPSYFQQQSFNNNDAHQHQFNNDFQSPAPPPPQYKHLGRMGEALHQYLSMLKAAQAMAQEDFSLVADGIVAGEQRPQSGYESSKRTCKVSASLMTDIAERFFWPFSELPLEDKRKITLTFKSLFCNLMRTYVTSKEYGPGDNRMVMPDGGYVQLTKLHLFFDSKLVTGDPEQVARIFHDAIQYLLINVVGHMRNIDMKEMELVAMVGLLLWADSVDLSSATLQLAQQVRNEIIIDLHHYYRSLGLAPEEITLKTANLFLLIPKLETVVKMMIENTSLSDLFNMLTVEESCKGHLV